MGARSGLLWHLEAATFAPARGPRQVSSSEASAHTGCAPFQRTKARMPHGTESTVRRWRGDGGFVRETVAIAAHHRFEPRAALTARLQSKRAVRARAAGSRMVWPPVSNSRTASLVCLTAMRQGRPGLAHGLGRPDLAQTKRALAKSY